MHDNFYLEGQFTTQSFFGPGNCVLYIIFSSHNIALATRSAVQPMKWKVGSGKQLHFRPRFCGQDG